MKLLIITQKIDKQDPVLGFFHHWVEEFSKHCEKITVICLQKGKNELPKNIKVLSLGKEDGVSRFEYLKRFYKYIRSEKDEYDSVFVHMNQEYILLGAIAWKTWRKKIFMWRNHHAGNLLTDIAAYFCDNVFCTSKFSYTAKYKKTIFMPVGIDTDIFKQNSSEKRKKSSILFLSRISPVKRPHILIEALKMIKDDGFDFSASFYGDPGDSDKEYYEELKNKVKKYNIEDRVAFFSGIPNHETPKVYSAHEIFVNLSSSGMYDKTIFEAMASGVVVLASNDNLKGKIDDIFICGNDNAKEVARKLEHLIELEEKDKEKFRKELRDLVIKEHSLKKLSDMIFKII